MHIVISGSTGLVGQALCAELQNQGHRVTRLVRSNTSFKAPQGTYSQWDPATGSIDPKLFTGVDAVINLCGENVASGWWTAAKKKRILESRTRTTATLANAIAGLVDPPPILLNASAVGYYGDRGEEILDEDAPSGSGFFAEIGRRWEAAAQPAIDKGVRVSFMRFGIVLSPSGGALAKMLPLFRLGLGAKLGDGDQYWSWISLPDAVGSILHLLNLLDAQGPYNIVSHVPMTNAQFVSGLAKALHRPAFMSIPQQFVCIMAGEMADQALLSSQRVIPRRLTDSGYSFKHGSLPEALHAVLD